MALSHILYTVGIRLPAEEIVGAAHDLGVPVLLDGAQTGGQIALDVAAIGADFYTVSGQKWLMGPTGTGALFLAPGQRDRLRPVFTELGGDSRTGLAAYELTSGSTVLRAGFAEAVRLHLEMGPAAVEDHARTLGARLRGLLRDMHGIRVIEPASDEAATGLTTVILDDADPTAVVDALWSEHRVAARAVGNPAGVRFSTAPFNDDQDLSHAVEALGSVLGRS